VDPESFAVEDMHHLFPQSAEAETRQFPCIIAWGDCGQVIQHNIEAGVGPAMKFPNTINGKQ
jgi:hypothetical protein